MADRFEKASLCRQNEDFVAAGRYTLPGGAVVDLTGFVAAATRDVEFYAPDTLQTVVAEQLDPPSPPTLFDTAIEVTPETSSAAAERLYRDGHHAVVLNFASATKPGGGYLTGATAQEEDICRTSALYTSLLVRANEFYGWHKANRGDGRYSHRLLWTPNVPVYRDAATLALLPTPHLVSFITAAAPNAGTMAGRNPAAVAHQLPTILRERMTRILAVAAHHQARVLVLGAWGCGVFRNDPAQVAGIFRSLLTGDGPFAGRFQKVVFAVYDTRGPTLSAFEDAFPVGAGTIHIDGAGTRPSGGGVGGAAGAAGAAGSQDSSRGHGRLDRGGRSGLGGRGRERRAGGSPSRTSSGEAVHDRAVAGGSIRERAAVAATSRHAAAGASALSPSSSPAAGASALSTSPSPVQRAPAAKDGTLDGWVVRKPPPGPR